MKVVYNLSKESNVSLYSTHDFRIKKVLFENEYLIFEYEDDITYHDSFDNTYDKYKSLVVRYHLIDDFDIYFFKKFLISKKVYYKRTNKNKLLSFKENELEFLYSYVGYQKIIVKLWNTKFHEIILDMQVDYIEYDWIEK